MLFFSQIDTHLFLAIFIPPLVFESAFARYDFLDSARSYFTKLHNSNFHILFQESGQAFLLVRTATLLLYCLQTPNTAFLRFHAVQGVLISTTLTALIPFGMFNQNW